MVYCYLYAGLLPENGASQKPRKEKGISCLYLLMENNQNPTPNRPNRMKLAPRDMLIVAFAVLALTRIDWAHMNSFHVLILFLLALMLMLRWGNMRKEAVRKQAMERYKAQFEADAAMQAANTPAEVVPAEDMTVDGASIPVAEASEESTPTESNQ